MPDDLSLLNVNETHHLEHLMWVVYDGALLVGTWPELPGNHQWCSVLVGLYKHIYRGCDDAAHCPLNTLASWDCQERTEALHREGKLGSAWSDHKRASRPRRRSRSSSRCHSRIPALRDWSGHSCCSPCKELFTNYANSLKLVFSSSYAGCCLHCLLVLLFLRVGSLRLFWGMFVRGCVRRDLC